jgi:hypothetical protein
MCLPKPYIELDSRLLATQARPAVAELRGYMSNADETRFSETVAKQLESHETARELWQPIAENYDQYGPESAREYLDAERQQLKDLIRRLLEEFEQQG